MSDATDAGTRIDEHNLVATYDSPDDARAALTLLERHGVPADDIELFGPGMDAARQPITNDEQRKADMDSTGSVAKRFSVVSFVAAVVGGVAGGIVGGATLGGPTGIIVGAVGGFIVLGLLGFLWGGYANLPQSEEWGETFASPGGRTMVAVHTADQSELDSALSALQGTTPRRLATCGRDGQLRDVA